MIKRAAILGALVLGSAAQAAEKPAIWETYPKLICRGDDVRFCDASHACTADKGKAIYLIDFSAGTLRAAVSKQLSSISDKRHLPELGYDSFYAADRGVFAFERGATNALGTETITGVTTNVSPTTTMVMWLDCNPGF